MKVEIITNKIKQAKLLISNDGHCFDIKTGDDYMVCTKCSFVICCNTHANNNVQLLNEANIVLYKHREDKLKRILK